MSDFPTAVQAFSDTNYPAYKKCFKTIRSMMSFGYQFASCDNLTETQVQKLICLGYSVEQKDNKHLGMNDVWHIVDWSKPKIN